MTLDTDKAAHEIGIAVAASLRPLGFDLLHAGKYPGGSRLLVRREGIYYYVEVGISEMQALTGG